LRTDSATNFLGGNVTTIQNDKDDDYDEDESMRRSSRDSRGMTIQLDGGKKRKKTGLENKKARDYMS
jgi:hypothetical protein